MLMVIIPQIKYEYNWHKCIGICASALAVHCVCVVGHFVVCVCVCESYSYTN